MRSDQKFFKCKHCGNMVGMVYNAGVSIICCGEPMEELVANTAEASVEKHLPVVTVEGNRVTVTVGSVLHPMTAEHHIEFIYIETERGGQRKSLQTGELPQAVFTLEDDVAIAAFAYCNLHGLWKTEIGE